jgi:hypothetical protein
MRVVHIDALSSRLHGEGERSREASVAATMDQPTLIERLARHLAAGQPEDWQARAEDAASILAILKEPDGAMREAGDDSIWRAMIDAALRERWTVAPPAGQADHVTGGADEEGEIRLTPETVGQSRADWVHLHDRQEEQ